MKHIFEAFSALIIIAIGAFVSIGIITASSDIAAAKEFKADCIAEIENSNFNSGVINSCIAQASSAGYELQVTNCTFDSFNDINTAEVILNYKYEIPLLGISVMKSTRGIAR